MITNRHVLAKHHQSLENVKVYSPAPHDHRCNTQILRKRRNEAEKAILDLEARLDTNVKDKAKVNEYNYEIRQHRSMIENVNKEFDSLKGWSNYLGRCVHAPYVRHKSVTKGDLGPAPPGKNQTWYMRMDWALVEVEYRPGQNFLPKGLHVPCFHADPNDDNGAATLRDPDLEAFRALYNHKALNGGVKKVEELETDELVAKYGRNTGFTVGRVKEARVWLCTAKHYIHQEFCISSGKNRIFSKKGDSGSAIYNAKGEVIGLLWGGGFDDKDKKQEYPLTFFTPWEVLYEDVKEKTGISMVYDNIPPWVSRCTAIEH